MNRQAGFTLLELLVALAVLGLVLTGLAGGLRFGLGAYQREVARVETANDPAAIDHALRRLIEQMEPGSRLDGTLITGDAGSLRFITRLPVAGAIASSDRIRAALFIRTGQLVLRWSACPYGTPVGPEPIPIAENVLLRGVDDLHLSYMNEAGQWLDGWNSAAPPVLVRLGITFSSHSGQSWPVIVSAPQRR